MLNVIGASALFTSEKRVIFDAPDGRLEMTAWLLKNGVTNVNAPDAFKRTSLKLAVEKGFAEVAELLRKNGGRETI